MFRYVLIVLVIAVSPAHADWTGKVVGITDGDTVTVMHDGASEKIRLIEIDAPESRQAFGSKSKQSLSELCFGKQATIKDSGIDKYGRTLGRVICSGSDANLEQVKRGMAWFYTKYGTDPAIKAAEDTARASQIGLWADPSPTPPWDFRHGTGVASRPEPAQSNQKGGFDCSGASKYCKQISSCEEAMYYLKQCGVHRLDRDGDGVPCENVCGG